MADDRPFKHGTHTFAQPVALRDKAQVAAVIAATHAGLAVSITALPHTAAAIPWFTLLFYVAVLSPSMVLILRDRPIEGIKLAMPFLRKLPLWTAAVSTGLLILHAGLSLALMEMGGGDASLVLELLQALILNLVVLAFISASAASLGLSLGFALDRHRLD